MAMIFCSKCGKQISDKAAACPHCGAPNVAYAQSAPQPVQQPARAPQNAPAPQRSKTVPFLVLIILLLVVGISVTSITLMKKNKSDSSSSSSKYENPANSLIVDTTKSPSRIVDEPSVTKAASQDCNVHFNVFVTHDKGGLASYSINVYVDDNKYATLGDEETWNLTLSLSKGVHKIRFESNENKHKGDDLFNKEEAFTITGDTTLSYEITRHTKIGNVLSGTKGIEVTHK